jgi:hypothetical protein
MGEQQDWTYIYGWFTIHLATSNPTLALVLVSIHDHILYEPPYDHYQREVFSYTITIVVARLFYFLFLRIRDHFNRCGQWIEFFNFQKK